MKGSITVIGGANLDINGFSREPLNMGDSNPGRVEYCPGGVGRNIAENLHRLGQDVRFIGVIGDDPGGELIRSSSARIGLNIEHSLFPKSGDQVTSVYLALMDSNGELKLALADMDIMEEMTEEHLEGKAQVITESDIVVLDTNLSEGIINFILDRFGGRERPRFYLDPVSARKAPKAAAKIGSFDTVKLGCMEASVLSGIEIDEAPLQREKLEEASRRLIGKGVRRIFITLGKEGVFAAREGKSFYTPVRYVPPVNTSGAGDAFTAGICYGSLQEWDDETIVSFSSAMAGITVQSKSAVSTKMCLPLVKEMMMKE